MTGMRSRWRRRSALWRGTRRRGRGISDVIATILLLALTVTLFAAIFAFVTTFPSPPAQNNNQFQASLFYPSNGTLKWIAGIRIVHLAGPQVPGNGLVYLKSANQPTAPEFQSPYTVASGLPSGNYWNLGQTWTLTFPVAQMPIAASNITIYIVSQSQLLFSVILPGTAFNAPPTVVSTWTAPGIPTVGQSFTVYATLAGNYKSNSVYVNLAGVPGGPAASQKMTQNAQGQWTYTLSSGSTSAGTYYGYVNASGPNGTGLTAVGGFSITVTTTGGTTNGPLSVGVVLVPSPPNGGSIESVQAVVTYTGPALSSPAAVTVSFSATSSPSGYTFSGSGPAGVTISGPSGPTSVTVASLSLWTIPNPASLTLYTFNVTATATVAGVGTVTGFTSFTPSTIVVGPTSGLMGSTATARGAGFVPATGVTLALGGASVSPSGSSNSTCTFSGSTITTTAAGTFVCRFVVPTGAPAGATTLVATDASSGQNDSVAYTVTPWTLTVGGSPGLVGNIVTARGAGFQASSSVTLTFNGITITPTGTTNSTCTFAGSTITATSTGTFVCRFVVPNGTAPGAATIVATDTTTGQVASYTAFTVTAWTITLSTTSYVHGTAQAETITGVGFDGSSFVSIMFNGVVITPSACSPGTLSGSTVTTTAAGGFVCTYTIASTVTAGVYPFTAIDFTSGQTATAYVRLT